MKASLSFSRLIGLTKDEPKKAPVVVQQPVVAPAPVPQPVEAPVRRFSFPKTAVPAPTVTPAPDRWTITVGDADDLSTPNLQQWCEAVSKGTTKDVTKMLKSGEIKVDVEINKAGQTALMLAAYLGREDVARCLLNNKADQNGADDMGRNAMMWAVAGGRDDVVTLLLDRGSKIDSVDKLGFTPLMYSAEFGQHSIADVLLESGARYVPNQDNSIPTPLQLAARWGWIEVVKVLLTRYPQMEHVDWADGRGWTALMEASSNGCAEVVKYLLEKEARVQLVDESFRNAIHIASLRGHVNIVEILLQARPDLINETDALGASALLLSVDQVRLPVAELLIARGAEFKADKEGFTIAHIASLAGMIDVLDMLNKKDRRLLDQPENRGRTPLLLAASKGNVDVCRYLVQEAQVNVQAVDLDGLTALMHAARGTHEPVVRFLLETNPQLFTMTDESCNTAVDYAPRSEMRSKLKACPFPLESYIRERLDKVHARLTTVKDTQASPRGIDFNTTDAEFESIRSNLVRGRVERQYDFVTRIMSVALARPIAAYNNVTPRYTAVDYLRKRVEELEKRPPVQEVGSPEEGSIPTEPVLGEIAAPTVDPLERAAEGVRNRARLVMALTERLQRKQRVTQALKTRADAEALSHGEARIQEYQKAVNYWETQKADLATERLNLSSSIANVSASCQPLKTRFGADGNVASAAPVTSLVQYAQLIDQMADRFHNDFMVNTTKLHQDIDMLTTIKQVVQTQCDQLVNVFGKDCQDLSRELEAATADYKEKSQQTYKAAGDQLSSISARRDKVMAQFLEVSDADMVEVRKGYLAELNNLDFQRFRLERLLARLQTLDSEVEEFCKLDHAADMYPQGNIGSNANQPGAPVNVPALSEAVAALGLSKLAIAPEMDAAGLLMINAPDPSPATPEVVQMIQTRGVAIPPAPEGPASLGPIEIAPQALVSAVFTPVDAKTVNQEPKTVELVPGAQAN